MSYYILIIVAYSNLYRVKKIEKKIEIENKRETLKNSLTLQSNKKESSVSKEKEYILDTVLKYNIYKLLVSMPNSVSDKINITNKKRKKSLSVLKHRVANLNNIEKC